MKQVEYPNRVLERGATCDLSDLAAATQRGKQVTHGERYEVRTAIAQDDWVALRVGWSAILEVPLG